MNNAIQKIELKKGDVAGFTLVESMVALVIFGFLAMGVSHITMMAFKLSYYNVYKTSAYSVMQGYIEQIKSLDSESLERAATGTISNPPGPSEVLQARSISLLSESMGVDQIDDWLVPNTLNSGSLSDSMDVVNHKQVVIDVDGATGERQMMDIWVDVEIHPLENTPGDVYLIDVQFIYALPLLKGGEEITKTVFYRHGSRDYRTQSAKMRLRSRKNEGRLQLVTSLLNFDSL
ncbi:type II secretion system protein [Kiritimatiellaeota bacterium B1221]|nr:type II secretion system protein [Kiritimatiellaeota bacterium B1221]